VPNTEVRSIVLSPLPKAGALGFFELIVQEEVDADFDFIANITTVFPDEDVTSVLQIDQLTGTLGEPGSAPGGVVTVGILDPIEVTGDVNADLSAVQGIYGSQAPLNRLRVVGGSLRGDISTLIGEIILIQVDGDIGSPSAPVTIITDQTAGTTFGTQEISASSIHMNLTSFVIRSITATSGDITGSMNLNRVFGTHPTAINAAGDLASAITVSLLPQGTSGLVQGFITAGGDISGTIDIEYAMNKTISAASITGDMTIEQALGAEPVLFDVAGDFSGNLLMNQGLADNKTIKIGGSLGSGAELAFGTDDYQSGGVGLAGQVIIDANDDSSSWDGEVRILRDVPGNDTVLTGPGYSQRSIVLGGGAVGEGPYGLHGTDCTPVDSASINGILRPSVLT